MLEQVMSGTVDGVRITEELMLLGGVMFEIPILMTILPLLLARSINRWTNIGAGCLTALIIAVNNLSPDLDNIFFMTIQLLALFAIVRLSWRWMSNPLRQEAT